MKAHIQRKVKIIQRAMDSIRISDKTLHTIAFPRLAQELEIPLSELTEFFLSVEDIFVNEQKRVNRKIENFLDNILSKLLLYNENYLGNLNGLLKIKLKNINNKVLKNGELNFSINEKKINLVNANFKLDKIGDLVSIINSSEKQGDIFFISQNTLTILDHIEFAKVFQISSKKVKNIKQIKLTNVCSIAGITYFN